MEIMLTIPCILRNTVCKRGLPRSSTGLCMEPQNHSRWYNTNLVTVNNDKCKSIPIGYPCRL